MSVHPSTLHKLLRERFAAADASAAGASAAGASAADPPSLRLNDDDEIERFRNALTERVAVKERVAVTQHLGSQRDRGQLEKRGVCGLGIKDSMTPSWRSDVELSFEIVRATASLHVRVTHDLDRPSYPVADLDQIAAFVADVQEALARARVREAKRDKLSKLRAHAVLARLKRIAAEDGFAFAIATEGSKVWLYVRLGARSLLELRFTHQGFEASIEAARPLIAAARAGHEKGVTFGVRASSTWRLRQLAWSDAGG